MNNRSKNDGDRGKVPNVSDINTAGIIEIEPPDVSHNEDEIVSQMKEVLDIHSKKKKKKKRRLRDHLDMKLFNECDMIQVEKIPWDIDGNKIYKKVSDKDFWIDEAHDGRWWKLCSSSRKGLKGERKFGNVWDHTYVLIHNAVS